MSDRDWKASFEKTYTGPPSAVAERIWRKVFGDAYPAGLDPNSLVSVDELRRIASMAGVERRHPLRDEKLVALALRLPPELGFELPLVGGDTPKGAGS